VAEKQIRADRSAKLMLGQLRLFSLMRRKRIIRKMNGTPETCGTPLSIPPYE
jgi:hypothetical protein